MVIFSLHLKQIADIPERRLPLLVRLKNVDIIGITLLLGFVACLCIALQDGGNRCCLEITSDSWVASCSWSTENTFLDYAVVVGGESFNSDSIPAAAHRCIWIGIPFLGQHVQLSGKINFLVLLG